MSNNKINEFDKRMDGLAFHLIDSYRSLLNKALVLENHSHHDELEVTAAVSRIVSYFFHR